MGEDVTPGVFQGVVLQWGGGKLSRLVRPPPGWGKVRELRKWGTLRLPENGGLCRRRHGVWVPR